MPSVFLSLLRGKSTESMIEVISLVPDTVVKAEQLVDDLLHDATFLKQEIIDRLPLERTYINTVKRYDELIGLASIATSFTGLFRQVSSDVEGRNKPYIRAQKEMTQLCKDIRFYKAFCDYREQAMAVELLTDEQKSFFEKAMSDFRRMGYDKDSESFAHLTKLEEKMQTLAAQFDQAFNDMADSITVQANELTGVASAFIQAQHRGPDGSVVLLCNKPTWLAILPHCTNPLVRKAFKKAYDQRAYPENVTCLQDLLSVRAEYAKALGYENYAEYVLSDYMVQNTATVEQFLDRLAQSVCGLRERDMGQLATTMPADVLLVHGALQSWDIFYVLAVYEKQQLKLDAREIAEYFPVDSTIAGVFAIYEQFMSVSFDHHAKIAGAWHDSVQGITVYTKDRSRILGYILLDLFPRPQKYSHACCWSLIPHIWGHAADSGMLYETKSLSVIVANFPKPNADAPALLTHADVTTFFHEFGHALHNVLSCTAHLQTSGSMQVMLDYIELPSQILEEWMWNPAMLKLVSRHYKTNQPLSDELIRKMTQSRMFGRSFFEMNQIYLSWLSLLLHTAQPPVQLDAIIHEAFSRGMKGVVWDEDNKFYTSFAHITAYGPAYYGYSLSRAYAYDVFARIASIGLLDENIGYEFVEKLLRPGGSVHPLQLLKQFLGRPASSDTYMNHLAAKV
jgi:thimet oligopeptidase